MRARPFGSARVPVPLIGQGTWKFPEHHGAEVSRAKAALHAGIELGLTHIDTAEMYGNGRSEQIVGEVIAGLDRARLFIVSKVLPSNASFEGTIRACERSLRHLGTDYLDCYLLHWRGSFALVETIGAFETLVDQGKIRSFGVSNFEIEDLDEARAAAKKYPVVCNQVLYHLGERRIEPELIPYCARHEIAVVGYSPFGRGGFVRGNPAGAKVLGTIAERRGVSSHAVALAFLVRLEGTFSIPKAADVEHVRGNAVAGELVLDAREIAAIDAAFPVRAGPMQVL